jgi:RNA polymerase sigma-70 factor (ECF subfamily)
VDPNEHLFRREAGRMVAALTRVFGVHNLALAEDVVQDALCRALEVWKLRGVPDNPAAWLMATAKNRALDLVRRERTARTFAPELGWLLDSEWTTAPVVAEAFGPGEIADDQLRLMFSCCHPRLSEEAQVALILNILCGFGTSEIAGAFLSSKAAIEKRLTRGKKVLAGSKKLFDLGSAADFPVRLAAVQRALYLLFNEGYHGAGETSTVRVELCEEAMRLTAMLLPHSRAGTPASRALAAMMCLHAARLPGRVDAAGELTSLREQDRSRWDRRLIAEGEQLLAASAEGGELSEYHLEAAIAGVHAQARQPEETRWDLIVMLYDKLLRLRPSPVVALGRAVAIGERDGPERGLEEILAMSDRERLADYPFYPAALGDLELRAGKRERAAEHFRQAMRLARNPMERRFFEQRVRAASQAAASAKRASPS